MNIDRIPDIIEDNLFGLYKTFAVTGYYSMVQHPSYTWIKTDKSVFPCHVFHINPVMNEDSLMELISIIKEDQAPPFLIFRNEVVTGSFVDRLKANGFRQVMQWPGMAIELCKDFQWISDSLFNLVIKKVKDKKEINDWTGMVEQILFNKGRLDRVTLEGLALHEDCSLYTGFYNGIPAGTLLSYINKQVAGFYMITTLPEFRNKGIAWHLFHTALKDAAALGCNCAVLESTQQGLSLYQKAGFKEYCNFAIYWMLGKNYHHE